MLSVIKDEFKETLIAFGKKGFRTLGNRDDLDELAVMAHKSGRAKLKNMFAKLPSLEELEKHAVDQKLKSRPIEPVAEKAAEKAVEKAPDTEKK